MLLLQIPVLEKVLRTIFVYGTIVVLFRLTGKRGLALLNTLDFTVLFLLSNVVQDAVIGDDTSLSGGAIGAVTLVAVNSVVNRLIAHSSLTARLFEGEATTVISDGRLVPREMRHLALRPQEIDQVVRLQSGETVSDVASGVLEPSGHLVIALKPEAQAANKRDIEAVLDRLARLEAHLTTRRGGTR